MREDTIAKKVFVYDINYGDVLLYDFSLSLGDTLKQSSFNWCGDLIVDSIGIITLFNSQTRKIFFLSNNEYYIEGIGGSQGLNNAMCWFEGWYEPFCVLKNGEVIYNFSSNEPLDCFQALKIEQYQDVQNINISPNPCSEQLNLLFQHPTHEPISLELISQTGKVVFSDNISNVESYSFNISNFASGLYLLRLTDRQQMQTYKIIVAH